MNYNFKTINQLSFIERIFRLAETCTKYNRILDRLNFLYSLTFTLLL